MTIRAFCADQLFTWHELVHNGCIVYKDNRIVDVGKKGSIDVPVDLFELKGYTLLPGLIDAHIHITGFRSGDYIKESLLVPYATFVARAIKDLESVLMAGYTTIVDAGSTISLELKKSAEKRSNKITTNSSLRIPVSQTFGHGNIHFLPQKYVDPRTSKLRMPLQSLLCDGADEFRKATRYALRTGSDFIKVFTTGGIACEKDRPEYP